MTIISNHGKSIRNKLLNLMKSSGKEYMYLLVRYFNERLLYRISVSRYKKNFVLKGGALLYAMYGLSARPTVDIDFMGFKISREEDHLKKIFSEILNLPCQEDGVTFDVSTLKPEQIAVDKKYPGVRFTFNAKMDTIVQSMSIDVGFGDIIVPSPQEIEYPLLLDTLPEVNLTAYSVETVIAEKFHAMIDRDTFNSRMKDFFDCHVLLTTKEIDGNLLYEAVTKTFENRNLPFNESLQLFSDDFVTDEARLKKWNAFLKKIRYSQPLTFQEVMQTIRLYLQPLYIRHWKERT